MKRILIYSFAVIGIISVLSLGFSFYRYGVDASRYLKNCDNVSIGMTIQEAKKIMGDYDYYSRKNRIEIWTSPFGSGNNQEYYLTYPSGFGASTGTYIYFDPQTHIVTKIVCGEKSFVSTHGFLLQHIYIFI